MHLQPGIPGGVINVQGVTGRSDWAAYMLAHICSLRKEYEPVLLRDISVDTALGVIMACSWLPGIGR